MRSGFDPSSYDWGSEYYEELRDVSASGFVQRSFAPSTALVSRHSQAGYQVTEEYRGQAYDPQEYELVPGGWSHTHCRVCRFRIESGHSYWETADRVWLLCDECYGRVAQRVSNQDE